ncbi:YraN family protein [Desulfogranum mediterraneum]|uniref:YraN family protein n=1 Tax=Desulfogranum mediterraneum TaxID=160661 RepID=UPI000424DB81|nr:YraN family protein [Desulfogranum mediterraneum]
MGFKLFKPAVSTGRRGERLAADHLLSLGYTLLARNYRRRFGEVDIIAQDGATIVFVEVKSRSGALFGSPFEAVDLGKQRQLSKIALDYLVRNGLEEQPARFDVVAVWFQAPGEPRLEHITHAFECIE